MEAWNKVQGRAVEWDGDLQNAPDRCEACDGTGRVYWILLDDLLPGYSRGERPIKWILSTNNLPDDTECPECHGYGSVYS